MRARQGQVEQARANVELCLGRNRFMRVRVDIESCGLVLMSSRTGLGLSRCRVVGPKSKSSCASPSLGQRRVGSKSSRAGPGPGRR